MRITGNRLYDILDTHTGEWVVYEGTTTGYDGTTITEANEATYIDGVIYKKLSASNGGGYIKRVIPNNTIDPRWFGITTDDASGIESTVKPLARKIGANIIRLGAKYKIYSAARSPFINGEGTHVADDDVTQFPLADGSWMRLEPINGKIAWSSAYNSSLSNNENFDRLVKFIRVCKEANTLLLDVEKLTFTDTITIPYNVIVEGLNFHSEETSSSQTPKTELEFNLNDDTKYGVQFSTNSVGGYLKGAGLKNVRITFISAAYGGVNAYELQNPEMRDINIVGNGFLKYGLVLQGCIMTVIDKLKIQSHTIAGVYLKSHTFDNTTTEIRDAYIRNSPDGVGFTSDPDSGGVRFVNTIFEWLKQAVYVPRGGSFTGINIYCENIPYNGDAVAIFDVGTDDPERPSTTGSLFYLDGFLIGGKPTTYTSNDDPSLSTVAIRLQTSPQAYINRGRIFNVCHPIVTGDAVDHLVYTNCLEMAEKHTWSDDYNGFDEPKRVTVFGVKSYLWETGLQNKFRTMKVWEDMTAAQYKLSALNTAPGSASGTGTAGEIRITSDYIYVCTATNTWKRAALTTW